ncbi:MAG: hypothetical protein QF896_05625 [Acidimicrobiales bacterium]|nr:hypothetical protein [Acidimicrobiales bacterium]
MAIGTRLALAAVLTGLLGASCSSGVSSLEVQTEELWRQVAGLQEQVAALQNELAELELEAELNSMDIYALAQQVRSIRDEVPHHSRVHGWIESDIHDLEVDSHFHAG